MFSSKKLWKDFWFQPNSVQIKTISAFRLLLGSLLFVFYFIRFLSFDTYYSNEGFLPLSELGKYDLNFNYYILDYVQILQSEALFYVLHILFLILLALLSLGLLPRWATLLTFFVHVLFLHRNPLINYGVDYYATYFLFYLSFIQHSQFFSLKPKKQTIDMLTSVGFRLLQIQLVVAYAYAGFEKLKGQTWWEGKAVWNSVINPQISTFDFSWMSHIPFVVAVLSFMTIIFEVYAPVAFFSSKARRIWLALGLGFHIGILLTLNIPFFALVMTVGLLIFVKDEELDQFLSFCKARKWRQPR
ncbi:MAG: HTTM domain-containing protein [Bdellovibrionales bacterium]|nr:HTTM domain-containing protein [Bdellovibrionales bacterium]